MGPNTSPDNYLNIFASDAKIQRWIVSKRVFVSVSKWTHRTYSVTALYTSTRTSQGKQGLMVLGMGG